MDVNILDFGAISDAVTVNTTAIQNAIDKCSQSGGGRVIIPSGTFISGTIRLKSNVELYLERGSVLKASTDMNDYNPDDVCLMSFKVKVNSGEGYVKPWVQDTANKKALFDLTKVGAAGDDWTECYLPFTGIADIRDAGIRFGGKIQNISIKDFKIINYKSTTTIDKLPSTIIN